MERLLTNAKKKTTTNKQKQKTKTAIFQFEKKRNRPGRDSNSPPSAPSDITAPPCSHCATMDVINFKMVRFCYFDVDMRKKKLHLSDGSSVQVSE